jgi:cytochrome c553
MPHTKAGSSALYTGLARFDNERGMSIAPETTRHTDQLSLLKSLLARIFATVMVYCCAYAAETPRPPLDSIDQRVQPCTACHGKEGRATSEGYYPRIAGKPAGYLFNQLINFRDIRRHFPMMTYITELQNENYLREMAAYFAAQRLPFPPPTRPNVSAVVLERGRLLVMEGDATLNLPSCRSCHGSRLVGVEPAVPGLLGLSQDYLLAQLGAWRNGTRAARPPDCMAEIVHRMHPEDVNATTAWLATQPVPEDAAPEHGFEHPPPLRCGSILDGEPVP